MTVLGRDRDDGGRIPVHALEADRLWKRYSRGGPWALRDITLTLPTEGVVGLVGPNGAGKSTLLRTWMGFERPSAGRVAVLGLDPQRHARTVLSHVAYLPQSTVLYRELTVDQHLDFVGHYRKSFDRHRAERRLGDLGIAARARVGALSGGQVAQVGLAIALGLRADILLLDEPLAQVDPLGRREFIDVLLDDVGESGSIAVLSSHVVSDIARACNHLVILGVGQTLLADPVARVLSTHVMKEGALGGVDGVIGPVPGTSQVLVRVSARSTSSTSVPPDLEQVVLGYLAANRMADP